MALLSDTDSDPTPRSRFKICGHTHNCGYVHACSGKSQATADSSILKTQEKRKQQDVEYLPYKRCKSAFVPAQGKIFT